MRGDTFLLSLVISILLVSHVSAVVINEFVVDPESGLGEWVELFNPANQSIDLTNWTLVMNDTSEELEILETTIPANGYFTLDPAGSQNNDGQILLLDNFNNIIDSVSYGDFDDGNISDNAPDGGADSQSDECLARMPNAQDTDNDSADFQKGPCTYNKENIILGENEQGLEATILGKIVLTILPRWIDFGAVQPGSTNNPSVNGNITFNATGSGTDVRVEITNVTGSPFDTGLRINGDGPKGKFWNLPCTMINNTCTYDLVQAAPTLNVPADFIPGPVQGTIIYTITGPTP
jgi:hypothetical protein